MTALATLNHSPFPPLPPLPPHSRSQWRRYAGILRSRWRVALGVFAATVALSVVWVKRQPPIYRATACLQTGTESIKVLDFERMRGADAADDRLPETVNTQVRILRSWTLCNQTIKALGLAKNADFIRGLPPGADLAEAVQNCLSVQPVRSSRLIEISVEHPSPQVAALLAEGITQQYIQQSAQQMLDASLQAVRLLGQQAEELKARLGQSEAALLQYWQKTDSVSLEERQDIVVATLKELNTAFTKAQTETLGAEANWTQVQALLNAGRKPADIPATADSAEVNLLRRQMSQKEIAIAALQQRYLPKHPAMVAALTELQEITAKHAQACEEAVRQIQTRYLTAKANEDKLQVALKAQEQKAINLNRHQAEYDELKRNIETDRLMYSTVLTRMKEASLMGKVTVNAVRLLDPVQIPVKPAKPNVRRIVALGVLLGLFGAIGISLLLDSLDDRIRSYDDVESLGLTMLSGVPRMQLADAAQSARVLQTAPNSIYADAFRGLRASISLKPAAKDAKTLMVTSTVSGEGKTVVAGNLSLAYALHGDRTLLVDCDLHHPGLGGIFKTSPELGLEKYLAGTLALEEIIQSTDVPNLEVITVGLGQHNCAELLASPRLPALLREAAAIYDRVVIDTPPVMAVSDPLILLPHVNGVVFVVGSRKTHREDIDRTMRKLRECGALLVGVVMNNVDGTHQWQPDYQAENRYYPREANKTGVATG